MRYRPLRAREDTQRLADKAFFEKSTFLKAKKGYGGLFLTQTWIEPSKSKK